MAAGETQTTRLGRTLDVLGLRPADVLRTAQRIAAQLDRPAVSRAQLVRFRRDPRVSPSEDKIFILVAAVRELTGWLVTAADLFEVEPALPEGMSAAVPRLSPRRTSAIDECKTEAPATTRLRAAQGWRAPLQDRSTLPGEDAFDALYTQYAVVLRGIAIHRYGIPPDEAEALVHDAFMAFLERHTSIRDARGWLSGTIRHKCTDYWRQRQREAPLPPEQDEVADPGAEIDVRSTDLRLTMATAINRLGDRCRETIRRYYWLEEPLGVIAGCFATTENNVKQILFSCRRRLRDFISGNSGNSGHS
jgi:RNA polymerase sigma factor (sigma-70 family)